METEFIAWLREQLPPHPCLKLGAGDDTALLNLGGTECLITVDMITDQVDFHLDQADPASIGRKALAVNLSDIAAMAGRPLAAVIALALPRAGALELAKQIYLGMLPLAQRYHVAIAGGDTNCWDGPLAISVTLLGGVSAAALCAATAPDPATGCWSPATSAAAFSDGTLTSTQGWKRRCCSTSVTSCTRAWT